VRAANSLMCSPPPPPPPPPPYLHDCFFGWIAISDGLIDRNGKPLGTDFQRLCRGLLTWAGRHADAYEQARQNAEGEGDLSAGRAVPF